LKIPDVKIFLDCIKILILSDTFELDYSYVISEIQTNKKLKSFMELKYVPEIEYLYKYISKLDSNCINIFFRNVFKVTSNTNRKGRKYVIIDSTAIPIDINTWRKRFKIGKNKKYAWSYSSSDGYYVGYKLILAIDAITFEILGFELYKGSPNDAKLLEKFVENLCTSKKLRMGDFVICDRGFTSMQNYHILISRFLLIPMIFARKNTDLKQLLDTLTPPLDYLEWEAIFTEYLEENC